MKRSPRPGSLARGSKTGRPVMVLLDLLGRRWTLRVIWELSRKTLNFRDLQAACGGILNTRLADLRDADIVMLTEGAGYKLTSEGELLLKEFRGLHDWTERWAKRDQSKRPYMLFQSPACSRAKAAR